MNRKKNTSAVDKHYRNMIKLGFQIYSEELNKTKLYMPEPNDNLSDDQKLTMISEMIETVNSNETDILNCIVVISKAEEKIKDLQEHNENIRTRIHKLINYHKP